MEEISVSTVILGRPNDHPHSWSWVINLKHLQTTKDLHRHPKVKPALAALEVLSLRSEANASHPCPTRTSKNHNNPRPPSNILLLNN